MKKLAFALLFLCSCVATSYGDISAATIMTQVNQTTASDLIASNQSAVADPDASNVVVPAAADPVQSQPQAQQNAPQNYWNLVLVFRSTCPFCQKFDPIITDFAKKSGFTLIAFSTDGGALPDIPNPLPATSAVITKFDPTQIPALYLVQKNTMQIIPISEGVITEQELEAKIYAVLSQVGDGQ